MVRDRIFNSRLSQYEAVIAKMNHGEIQVPGSLALVILPPEYSKLAVATLAERDANGVLTVEFLIGGGFPVKHVGYLFRSKGELKDWWGARRWRGARQISQHWYRIAD